MREHWVSMASECRGADNNKAGGAQIASTWMRFQPGDHRRLRAEHLSRYAAERCDACSAPRQLKPNGSHNASARRRAMNILLITSVYPRPCAPVDGVFNENLVSAMAERHAVRVICPVSWTSRLRRAVARSTARNRAAMPSSHAAQYSNYYYPPKILRSRYGDFLWWSVRAELERLVAAFRPDLVVGYWAHPDGEAAVRIARRLGVPSAIIVGGSDVLLITKNAKRRRAVISTLAAADAVIAVSENLRQRVIADGIPEARVHAWSQGVDRRFAPGDRKAARLRLGLPIAAPMALWVGRMVPVKGLDVLLVAASLVRAQLPAFQLHLVGDGSMRQRLVAQCRQLRLEDTVRFVGVVPHASLPDWYRAADVSVISSWSEGLPNVLRESAACGTPFVATAVGGTHEIAGHYDRLVAAGDAKALAHALIDRVHASTPVVAVRPTPITSWGVAVESLLAIAGLPVLRTEHAASRAGEVAAETTAERFLSRPTTVLPTPLPVTS